MKSLLLPLLLAQAINDHGIYTGFNPQWVYVNGNPSGAVSLTIGSAVIDGVPVENSLAGGWPSDITAITPYVPTALANYNYTAYCYVVDVGTAAGSSWFAPSDGGAHFDFVCEASDSTPHNPTSDGHPVGGLSYPPGTGPETFTHAIFVGSVVGGNDYFSTYPFFRNGDQVIYATNTTCSTTYYNDAGSACANINSDWDLGVPTGQWKNAVGPLRSTFPLTPVPYVSSVDFTQDGIYDSLPYSASQIILDTEGRAGIQANSTVCFLDPNYPTIPASMQRSCQSEQLLETNNIRSNPPYTPFQPLSPYRTQLNIGYSPDAGSLGPYGMIWFGGTGLNQDVGAQAYVDLSYRGYVEPERQLISHVVIPNIPP